MPAIPKHFKTAPKAAYDTAGPLSIIASDIKSPVAERVMHNNKNFKHRFLPAFIASLSSLGLSSMAEAEIMLYDKDQTTFSTDGYINAFYVNSDVDRAGEQYDRRQARVPGKSPGLRRQQSERVPEHSRKLPPSPGQALDLCLVQFGVWRQPAHALLGQGRR